MYDGVTKSIFAHLIPAKGMDFPGCEKVVKTITKDLDRLGYRRVVFRCGKEPSMLAMLRAVKLVWQWSCARNVCRGRPAVQRRCRKFCKNVIKGMSDRSSWRSSPLPVLKCQRIMTYGFANWSRLEDGIRTACECGGCRSSHEPVVWAFWILALSKAGIWDQGIDRTRSLLALQVAL